MRNKKHWLTPKNVYIESTNLCNASCLMCPNVKMKRARGTMSHESFQKVIAQVGDMNPQDCTLYLHKEGEPLLDPDLVKKIRYAKTSLPALKSLAVNTNASLLTEDLARNLIDSGLDVIFFSLDSMKKERYEKWRAGLDFDLVIDNIRRFIAVNRDQGSKVHIVVQMLVSPENQDEVETYRQTWSSLGVEVFIKQMHNYLDVSVPGMPCETFLEQKRMCKDPFDTTVVFWNGDVGVCCWDYDNLLNMGNIHQVSLAEIFNSPQYQELRTRMRAFEADRMEPCSRCSRIFGQHGISGVSSIDGQISRQEKQDEKI